VDNDNFKLLTDTCHVQMCAVIGAHQWGEEETLPGGQLEFFRMAKGMIGDVHIIDSDNKLHDNHTSDKLRGGFARNRRSRLYFGVVDHRPLFLGQCVGDNGGFEEVPGQDIR